MHVYEYDDIYQITDVNYPTGLSAVGGPDDAGNRTAVIETGGPTTSYVTNATVLSSVRGPTRKSIRKRLFTSRAA